MYGVELYFVVMLNIFPIGSLSERYDLKGSWENRHGFNGSRKQKRKESGKTVPLFQDNDLRHMIAIDKKETQSIAIQIKKDITFLKGYFYFIYVIDLIVANGSIDLNFMDYSLLLGVKRERFHVLTGLITAENCPSDDGIVGIATVETDKRSPLNSSIYHNEDRLRLNSNFSFRFSDFEESKHTGPYVNSILVPVGSNSQPIGGSIASDAFSRKSDGGMPARTVEGPGMYYFGIVDILQEWNFKKELERFYKVYVKQLDKNGISAMNPNSYAERFWRRCVLDTFEGVLDEDESNNLSNDIYHEDLSCIFPQP